MFWPARIISLAIVALLADAALGSAGSSWWTVGECGAAMLAGLAASIVFWKRPIVAAASTVLAAVGVFALGTIAGVERGPRFTALDAASSAAGVELLGLATAAIVVFACFKPLGPRIPAIAFLCYAVLAVGSTVGHGGLGSGFRTSPLAWTGGPYLTVEVIFPLSVIVACALAIRLLVARRGVAAAGASLAALALLAATQLGAAAAGAQGLPSLTAFERISPQSDGAFGPFESGEASMFTPSGSDAPASEVVAAAKTVAGDPASALAAVASLANDFYSGALGGSVGALRSGSGNSIDKALLLRDLLRVNAPGVETAFAQCTLDDASADQLLAAARSAANTHPQIILQAAGGAAATASDPKTREALQTWDASWKAMVGTTKGEGDKLAAVLKSANVAMPQGLLASARLRALAADHVWLRAKIDGNWVDLDPTFAHARPGQTRCAPQSTQSELWADRYDTLAIRLVAETAAASTLQRTVLLARTVRTVDVADRDVSLMFAETVGLDALPAPLVAAPEGASSFTPVLRVGSENIEGTPLLLPSPSDQGGLGGGIANAIASALDTPAPLPAPSVNLPSYSGLWSELAISAPGIAPVTARSLIFDRIGFAARASHAPVPTLTASLESDGYRAMQTVWSFAIFAAAVASGTGPAVVGNGNDAAVLSANLARLNGEYTSVRRALVDDALGAAIPVAGLPGISILAMTNSGQSMNIASDATVPLTANDARPVWAAASLVAERAVTDGNALSDGASPSAAGDALTALDAAGSANSVVSDDARARVAEHVGNGDEVLALLPGNAASARSFEWFVDGKNGTLRDEDSLGLHSEVGEEAVQTNEVAIKNVSAWRKFTCSIMPVIRAATFALSVAHNGSPFSPAGAAGLAGGQRAATQAAVDAAQAGQDQAVACGGP